MQRRHGIAHGTPRRHNPTAGRPSASESVSSRACTRSIKPLGLGLGLGIIVGNACTQAPAVSLRLQDWNFEVSLRHYKLTQSNLLAGVPMAAPPEICFIMPAGGCQPLAWRRRRRTGANPIARPAFLCLRVEWSGFWEALY